MQATYDAGRLIAERPIRIAMADGLHVRVVQRISLQEARDLIAELETACACAADHDAKSLQSYYKAGGSA